MPKKEKKGKVFKAEYYDFNLVAVVILLICFGLVMLYSTSAYTALVKDNNDMAYFAKQAIISACSIVGALAVSKLDYHLLYYVSGMIYWVSMGLMALVKFSPMGVEVNGAKRWLNFGIDALQFQPAEVAKIAAITFIPCLIMKMGKEVATRKGFWKLMAYGGGLAAAALIFTDNLSTAIIIGAITGFMIFIAHPNQKMFLRIILVLAVLLLVGRIVLQMTLGDMQLDMTNVDSFRLKRVLVWLNPEQYSSAGGYQIMQALYAIGSGGFFGKGLGNSVQKLGPVPEAQNDMIFSIVCEELGCIRRSGYYCAVWLSVVPPVLYCPECQGFLRFFDGQRNYGAHCFAGYFKYLRCVKLDTHHRNHPSFCQLRRYVHCVFDGRDGHCPQRFQTDLFWKIKGLTNRGKEDIL